MVADLEAADLPLRLVLRLLEFIHGELKHLSAARQLRWLQTRNSSCRGGKGREDVSFADLYHAGPALLHGMRASLVSQGRFIGCVRVKELPKEVLSCLHMRGNHGVHGMELKGCKLQQPGAGMEGGDPGESFLPRRKWRAQDVVQLPHQHPTTRPSEYWEHAGGPGEGQGGKEGVNAWQKNEGSFCSFPFGMRGSETEVGG